MLGTVSAGVSFSCSLIMSFNCLCLYFNSMVISNFFVSLIFLDNSVSVVLLSF